MSEWIDINDSHKPKCNQEVLVRMPVVNRFVIESAEYIGENRFIGAFCDTRGDGCSYTVSHWMPRPPEPK